MSYAEYFNVQLTKGNYGEDSYIRTVYYQLFSLLTDEELNRQLEYLYELSSGKDSFFKETGKDNWFAIWHKSIRQCDFFEDCFVERTKELITKDEEKEFRYLLNKYKVEKVDNRDSDGKLNDEFRRYLELWEYRRRQKIKDNINGRLDSILWNTIHMDTDNVLYNAFKRTFRIMESDMKKSNLK